MQVWEQGAFHWPTVRNLLQTEYELRVEEDDRLCILSACHHSPLWRAGTALQRAVLQQSRGVVIEKATGRVVCPSFPKFWNAGEKFAAPIEWERAVASEKVDGCLMKLFWYGGEWRLASNRTLAVHRKDGKYACTGRSNHALFVEAAMASGLDYTRLQRGRSYLLERVHPEFAIVIVPPAPKLYHLTTYDVATLREVPCDDVGLTRPTQWTVRSYAQCQQILADLHGEREGLVIRDSTGRRIKLKRTDYVLRHLCAHGSSRPDYSWVARAAGHAATQLPAERLCLAVWLREEVDEFAAYFPEHRSIYQQVASVLERVCDIEDVRARDPADGTFVHEPRLWTAYTSVN